MTELIWPLTTLAVISILCAAALRGWRGWLDLRRYEIAAEQEGGGRPDAAGRIGFADLKERVRKLEAIAQGVDP